MSDVDHARALARWRLVLGRFAEERVPLQGNASLARMDQMLDYLYGREYARRGVRAGSGSPGGGAGRGPSTLTVPDWIREDPETLQKLEPNYDLLKTLLTFRGLMTGPALELARKIIRQVVDDLRRRLSSDIRPVLWGRLDRTRRTRMRAAKNLDFRATVRANLQHWDVERKKLLARDLWFRSRVKRHLPWTIIIAVDCSGSMLDSVIHSAVMAGIFARLPAVRVKLLAFDTSVVDLSDTVDDPAELLMSVQLGGGTDIGGALAACASLVEQPTRTIVIVVTDFCEGGPPIRMLATIRKLRSEGVRVLGLAALDREAKPSYDRKIAEACADAGAEIGAFTPRHLAEWVAKVLS